MKRTDSWHKRSHGMHTRLGGQSDQPLPYKTRSSGTQIGPQSTHKNWSPLLRTSRVGRSPGIGAMPSNKVTCGQIRSQGHNTYTRQVDGDKIVVGGTLTSVRVLQCTPECTSGVPASHALSHNASLSQRTTTCNARGAAGTVSPSQGARTVRTATVQPPSPGLSPAS